MNGEFDFTEWKLELDIANQKEDGDKINEILNRFELKRNGSMVSNWILDVVIQACDRGWLENIKSLLRFKGWNDLGWEIDLNGENGYLLALACNEGHLNIVQFLLSDEMKHYQVDVHCEDDLPMERAVRNHHWHVVDWLVLTYQIEETEGIKELMEASDRLTQVFNARNENQLLKSCLMEKEMENENKDSSVIKKLKL